MKKGIFLILTLTFSLGYCFWSELLDPIANYIGYERCNSNFIKPDIKKLKKDFNELLYGQNIVINKLISTLKNRFNETPRKALVICMHGWTGSGKSHVTKLIINNLYKYKGKSKFVHFFNGRIHFPRNKQEYVDEYKTNIQNWIKGNTSNCHLSTFIFDEVDKIPAGVLDGIKPYFDYHDEIDSVNFKNSIFIFISNIGGSAINRKYMNLWKQGILRDDMRYKDFESDLRLSLYSTEGAFHQSSILDSHSVSLYLPFLPLGEEEVRKCIITELKNNNKPIKNEIVEDILNEMDFNTHGLSVSGCKRVADLVNSFRYDSDEL